MAKPSMLLPDKANCTYWWIIHLNPYHPKNKPSVPSIHGYSKFQNHAEARDKNHVIMSKVEMFHKNGYLERADRIDFYKKMGPLPNKDQDKLIISFYPKQYVIPVDIIDNSPRIVREYLTKFYEYIKTGNKVEFLRPLPSKAISKDSSMNIDDYYFETIMDLYEFADKMKSNGEAPGLVNDFIRKYSEKHFVKRENNGKTQQINSISNNLLQKFTKK